MIYNHLLQTFLSDENINKLYISYLEKPTTLKKDKIEKLFQIHARKIQLLSYFSKILHFESQKYDKKIRRVKSLNQLILDKKVNDGEGNLLNLIKSEESFDELEFVLPINSDNLGIIFEDKHVYEIVSKLNDKQRNILYLIFVENLTEYEVAQRLSVTKQAVNKTKNQTLKKIKQEYELIRRNVNAGIKK